MPLHMLALSCQVIMLVESVDGSKALLGRSHQSPRAMFTTLSGFLDQCESIEEVGVLTPYIERLHELSRA